MNNVTRYVILVISLCLICYIGEDFTRAFNYLYFYAALLVVIIPVVIFVKKHDESVAKKILKGFLIGWIISIVLNALFSMLYYPYSMEEMFAAIKTVPFSENAFLFIVAPLIRFGWAVGIAIYLLFPEKATQKKEGILLTNN